MIGHRHVNDYPDHDHDQRELQKDQRVIEDSDALEFFPIMFDYMRRKYDYLNKDTNTAAVMALTRYMSPEQSATLL